MTHLILLTPESMKSTFNTVEMEHQKSGHIGKQNLKDIFSKDFSNGPQSHNFTAFKY